MPWPEQDGPSRLACSKSWPTLSSSPPEFGGAWCCNFDFQTNTYIIVYHACTCELIWHYMLVSIFVCIGRIWGMNEQGTILYVTESEGRQVWRWCMWVEDMYPQVLLICILMYHFRYMIVNLLVYGMIYSITVPLTSAIVSSYATSKHTSLYYACMPSDNKAATAARSWLQSVVSTTYGQVCTYKCPQCIFCAICDWLMSQDL